MGMEMVTHTQYDCPAALNISEDMVVSRVDLVIVVRVSIAMVTYL